MVLTELPNLQDLTKHPGKLNGTAPKGTLMLIFSTAVLQNNLQEKDPTHTLRAAEVLVSAKTSSSTYPDIGILMKFSQVEHIVQCQHPWRSLSKIHGWIDVILWKESVERTQTN